MSQVNLEQNGFIKSVKQCIELIQAFGDKLTPELLQEYVSNSSKQIMTSQEFLEAVVNSVITGGDDFITKMEELYAIKDEIVKILDPQVFNPILEGQARKIGEEYMFGEMYLAQLASFVLAQDRFRDYLYAYMKMQVADEIRNLDYTLIINKVVQENADEYAKLLLKSTNQTMLKAEASLLITQAIEQYCAVKHCNLDQLLHPQPYPKEGEDGNA